MTFKDDQFGPQERTQYTGGSGPATAEFKPGQTIGDNYQVLAWIGAGGMGNVYRVRHTIMRAEYALKTLNPEGVTDVAWRRFQNEAQAIARMSHPNIVGIYNLGLHEDRLPYYVMDLLKGQTLNDVIKTKGPLEVEEALNVFIEVCAGIGYAHKKGIVHRDIKPPNILLIDNPGPGNSGVKIVDFGIVKLTGVSDEARQKLTNVGETCGSPYYMSPEQCEGGKVDARSDIYSLGCTLFEVLTGSTPYKGRNAMETMFLHQSAKPPTLTGVTGGKPFPPMLERAIATMLAKAPMDRYQNMESVSEDLHNVLKGKDKAVEAYRVQSQTQGSRRPAVHRSQLQEEAVEEGRTIKVKPLLSAAFGLVIMAVACILWHPQQTEKTSNANTSPLISETKDSRGNKQIVFNFPQDATLGEILIDSPTQAQDTKSIVCQGKQTLEAGHKLYFFPTETCICHPEYFHNFGPAVLHSITLPSIETKPQEKLRLALLQIIRLKGLKRLDFIQCAGMSDDLVGMLDQCPELEDLALNGSYVSVDKLVKCQTIKRIKSLVYTYAGFNIGAAIVQHEQHEAMHRQHPERDHHGHGGHHWGGAGHESLEQGITPLLDCLTKCPKLEVLEMPNVPLYPKDLQILGQLKQLQAVDLSNSNIFSVNIEALANLPNLYLFHADNCLIDASAIPAFKKLANHSLKYIYMQSPTMTKETLDLYRNGLPGVTVNQ